jgi:hypothetical protein
MTAGTGGADALGTGGGSTVPCPPGGTPCGDTCADLENSTANCGSCGNLCPLGSACVAGACEGGEPMTEADLAVCTVSAACVVVPYTHCCGATKRAINGAYLSAYLSHPEWQVFAEPGACAVIGMCPDDRAVTSATCADGFCALVYP